MTCLSPVLLRLPCLMLALVLWAMPAAAQNTPSAAAPAPLTPQQFDQLVDSLARAVSERLKTEASGTAPAAPAKAATEKAGTEKAASGKPAPAASPAPAAGATAATPAADEPMMDMASEEPLSEVLIDVIERGDKALEQFPALLAQGARIPTILGPELNGGRDPNKFLLFLAGCVAAALGTELLLRLALRPVRFYLARRVEGAASIWALTALVSLDIVVLTGMWLVTHALVIGLFNGHQPQDKFGYLVLTSVFYWRLYLLIFRIALRPALPQARLASVDTEGARRIYRWASLVILVAITLGDIRRILEGMHSSPLVVTCAMLVNSLLLTTLLVTAAIAVREPVALWFHGLSQGGRPGPLVRIIARLWLIIGIPIFLILGMASVYGALTTLSGVHEAILMTLDVLIALLVLESFMDKVCQLMRADAKPATAARERAIEALMRCIRVAILLGSLSLLFRIWAVHGVGMMDMSSYNRLAEAALPTGAILLGAYCAWQAVDYFTTVYGSKNVIVMPGQEDPEDNSDAPASRVSTLMPLLRVTLFLAILVMAGLTLLSQLGIDIMPLIAGASIIGLAISFGSQTLVKDIVSGVFYLVDDAFRVGEYIDCGRAKGTVEGFTLRSLKLRHQNGMIHTIPFGQLGQVTNFSRDWATLKFNLRFTRDTDLEKLRKAVKKIGLEMLQEPDLKDDFLMPLKMQGVADVTDNALVVRFKFTVKPARPTVIQREAIKRMIRMLPEQGIEFANNMVSVQALGGPTTPGTEQAAAAITRTQIANDIAQRAAVESAAAS